MTTSLRIKLPAVLALLVTLASGRPDSLFGGCYCMMESKTISASYNKTGFEQYTYTNGPVQIFLESKVIDISEYYRLQNDSAYFYNENWSDLQITQTRYSLTGGNDTGNGIGCKIFTLPYTSLRTGTTSGLRSDSSSSLDWNNINNGTFTAHDTQNNSTEMTFCGGTWHQYYSDQSPASGSGCDGTFPYGLYINALNGYWPWEQISAVVTEDQYSWENAFYVENGGSDSYFLAKGMTKRIEMLSSVFSDGELRKQILARLPDWPEKWSGGSGVAAYILNGEHTCGSGSKMKYRLKVPNSEKLAIYKLEWQEVTVAGTNTTYSTLKENITGNGDPINPAVGQTHDVDMPGEGITIYETAPDVVEVVYPGGGGGGSSPGTGGPRTDRPKQ